MPSDYYTIRTDNEREYGKGTRHLAVLGRLYTDRTHFIFELLQNAEDAGASRILFRLLEDRLEVTHDGRPFNELDVRGVCGVGEGTKAEDLTQIGKFGIGFKSVYAYTSTPEIHSGDESFRIEHYVRPYGVESKHADDSWTTLFVFGFDAGAIEPHKACQEIGARLQNLSARTLLFLHKMNEIEYRLPDGTGVTYLREERTRSDARQVTVIGHSSGQDEDETWVIFEKPVPVPDSTIEVPVEIGFRLEMGQGDRTEQIVRVKEAPLVVYFPTEKETRLGFLIQGPYRTTPGRDNVPNDDSWNKKLIAETAELAAQALRNLKAMGLLSVSLLEALPIRKDDFPENGMFHPIFKSVREALLNEELLPAADGTFVAARNAKLARGADLTKLINQGQLCSLFGTDSPLKWLTGEITPDVRAYLLNTLQVEEITPDIFARRITQAFLVKQPDDWFVELYRYLSDKEALWRPPRRTGDSAGFLRTNRPILRLQDDSLVAPFRLDGTTPNAFCPPPEETDFPVVKRTIAADKDVAGFLTRLGLAIPDIFAHIIEKVLPKYASGDVLAISPEEHAADIDKMLLALRSDSEEAGRRRVMQAARQTPFLSAIDPNGNVHFQRPIDIYFPAEELTGYFAGNPDVWLLKETKGKDEWYELGVENKPRFRRLPANLSKETRSKLRGNTGCAYDIETIDYQLDGIESFLNGLAERRDSFKEHSLILWRLLLEHLEDNSNNRFYDGQYTWQYYRRHSATFDADWKKRLRSHEWLPKKGDDRPHRPSELSIVDLPELFERNDRLADLLGMKKDVVAELAQEAGIPIEDIDLMRQHPEDFRRWKATVAGQNELPAFPTKSVPDPDRRKAKVIDQIHSAPDKKYESCSMSTRTTEATEHTRTWLREQYTRDSELHEMVCQICQQEMPFKKRDSEHYYFEAVEALTRDLFPREHEAQFLALCPLCAAKYKEFVKNDKSAMGILKQRLMDSVDLEVPLKLDRVTRIRFVETHFRDIKTILESTHP